MLEQHDGCVAPVRGSLVPSARVPVKSVLQRLHLEDRLRLRRILAEPIEYLGHPRFNEPGAEQAFFGDTEHAAAPKPWCNSHGIADNPDVSTLPGSTLSADAERILFLRMNYARYRMTKLLADFEGKRLTGKAVMELLGWQWQVMLARCEIVQSNVPLVLAMAKRTRLGSADYAELISEGNMALLRSVDKFDCGRGFKFSTYACRAILKSFSRVAMKASRYRSRFPAEFEPALEKSDHLDRQRIGHEADCVDELRDILRQNTADLNDVEVKVLQARFALSQAHAAPDDAEAAPKTLEQVGLLIGVTKERVRQIQNRALQKLRTKLNDDFLAA